MISLRPATAADQDTIVQIIHAAHINPLDIKWDNFVVAVDDATDAIVGTGQIKRHRDGSYELASIATVPEYQRRGIASQIVEHLLDQHAGDLYLTCTNELGPFYERFGFVTISGADLPPYFRRLARVAGALQFLASSNRHLLVMKRAGAAP